MTGTCRTVRARRCISYRSSPSYRICDRNNAVDRDKGSHQMNIRTSFIAVGATLALVAPAAANARAIVSQSGDMYFTYFTSEHGSHAVANMNLVSENGHMVTSGKTQRHKIVANNPGGKRIVASPAVARNAYVDPNDCGDYGGTETCANIAAAPQDASPASTSS